MYTDSDFGRDFLLDESTIAIPLNKYAIRYSIDKGILSHNNEHLRMFVSNMMVKSEEDLKLVVIDDRRFFLGPIMSHRIFYNWLLTQTFVPAKL